MSKATKITIHDDGKKLAVGFIVGDTAVISRVLKLVGIEVEQCAYDEGHPLEDLISRLEAL